MHTPGPWQLVTSCDGTPSVGVSVREGYGTGFVVAHCNHPSFKNGATGSAEANARLIAAAPDLLEALQHLCSWVVAGDRLTDELEVARAAIAKATGGE